MIRNATRNTIIAGNPARAVSFSSRLLGLMGKKRFPGRYDALVFEKCTSIHCFFMRMAIDVVFVDKEKKVTGLFHELPPWRLAFGGMKSCDCIELPAGTLKETGTVPGDQLVFEDPELPEKKGA